MLQTRNAKRPAQAAVRFAVDAVEEGLLDRARGDLRRSTPASSTRCCTRPSPRDADFEVLAAGVPASPGAAKGAIVFTAADAVAAAEDGRDVILVRPFTEAEDVAGFHAAQGHPHRGGRQGLARGAGRPRDGQARASAGAPALEIDLEARKPSSVNGHDAERGRPDRDRRHRRASSRRTTSAGGARGDREHFETVLGWADELRTLGVRANADTPEDAAKAREFGAEGIGLCRTEHMFMAADRQPKMRAMIMAESEEERRARARRAAAAPAAATSRGCSRQMSGLPVTIRLLDPPLHEFLPAAEDVAQDVERARIERVGRPRGAGAHARPRPRARRDQPDARHPRRAARRAAPGDLRDAGARRSCGRRSPSRAHRHAPRWRS